MSSFFSTLQRIWCDIFHEDIFRPINGRCTCKTCFRTWPCPEGM